MIVSLRELLTDADRRGYAIGAFNCLSQENVMGAIRAAEDLRSPLILQLAEVQFPEAPLAMMAPLFLGAAERAKVPVCVHLDHGLSLETCIKAIRLGFTSVMLDASALPYEDNLKTTMEISRIAKAAGVDVEAELGHVGDCGVDTADVFTEVEQAVDFVSQTGIDALAVAIGNLHGHYIATPQLNIKRLNEIHEAVSLPLVLHGGSGTSVEDFKACLKGGICKINVATAIQLEATKQIQHYLATAEKPAYIPMKRVIEKASYEVICQHMELFESNNKA